MDDYLDLVYNGDDYFDPVEVNTLIDELALEEMEEESECQT